MSKSLPNDKLVMEELDVEWFSSRLNEKVVSIQWHHMECQGLMSSVKKVRLQMENGAERELILKILGPRFNAVNIQFAIDAGCAREADFHNCILSLPADQKDLLCSFLPQVFWAESDWETGEKRIIMQDLSQNGIVSNLYFGPNVPLNWGKDIKRLTTKCPDVDPVEITRQCFIHIARLHALFWNCSNFPDMNWLRGCEWMQKNGQAEWEGIFNGARSGKCLCSL